MSKAVFFIHKLGANVRPAKVGGTVLGETSTS